MKIPVYSIVAYSGTGKTTFLERLIPELRERGVRVAVIKHDTHEFEVDCEGKDSWRMTRAGAEISVIMSDTHVAYMENRPVSVEAMLEKITGVDIILTEGYKTGTFKKIALYRKLTGKPFPCEVSDCLAIVTDEKLGAACPELGFDNAAKVAELICSDAEKQKNLQ